MWERPRDVDTWRAFWRLPEGHESFTEDDWTAWHTWRCSILEERYGLGIHYDKDEADRRLNFFRALKHVKGEWDGRNFHPLPWQEHQLLRALYGYLRANGLRLFRETLVYVPKKNGKSEIAAAIVLDQLFMEGEPGAEIYGGASDSKQASLIFNVAHAMVKKEPELKRLCKPLEATKRIIVPNPSGHDSKYEVLTAEVGSKEGFSIQCLSLDEIEVIEQAFFDVLTDGSTAARRQPIKAYTGTGGSDFNKPWYALLGYAQGVEDGLVEDSTFLPVLYMLREDEDWTDPEAQKRANPSLGVTITWEDFEAEFRKALAMPHKQGSFKRRRLNMPVADDVARFIPMGAWDANAPKDDRGQPIVTNLAELQAVRRRMLEELKGRECIGWLDLSSKTDLTTFGLLFPNADGSVTALPWVFLPRDNLEARGARDRAQYQAWADHGFIELTDGTTQDQRRVRALINEVRADYRFNEIAYDDWNAGKIEIELAEEDGFTMTPIPQNLSHMNAPTKELLALVLDVKFDHGGNPVMRYCCDNLKVDVDSNERVRPNKSKSTGRIDVVVGPIMALSRLILAEPEVEEAAGGAFIIDVNY